MSPSTIYAFVVAHPEAALLLATLVLSVPGVIYALVKTAYQRITGLPAKGRVWTTFDVIVEVLPNIPGGINRLFRASGAPSIFAPPAADATPPAPPPSNNGQRGRATVGVLLIVALFTPVGLGVAVVHCGPRPVPVDGGPAVTPSSWTDGARVALSTLSWAVPAAKAIVTATVNEPGRTQVNRALDATAEAARRMESALVAYETAGGDRCLAKSATAGVHAAIVVLAQVLADNGIALGTTIERIADALAAIVDVLTPACEVDASPRASAGDASNTTLRAIAESARARGVVLRRVLDDLRPLHALDAGAH